MASSQRPFVSVVSLTYNRKDQVSALLSALRRQAYPAFEIILVDNASTDGTSQTIRQEFPEVTLIQAPENQRNYSYNLGIAAARGDYVVMMDDDGLPGSDDWISQVVECLESDPKLAVVACTVRMQDTGRIAADSPQFVPELQAPSGYPCAAYNGTGVALRKRAVEEVWPMYPKPFFHTYIELDLCTRLVDKGWKVKHFPEIEVWHCRASDGSDPTRNYYGLRNYYWYIWTRYPWPAVVFETAHQLAYNLKLVSRRQVPFSHLTEALCDAMKDFSEALRCRHPVSLSTVTYFRRVRRHGNWHGIAPESVSASTITKAEELR